MHKYSKKRDIDFLYLGLRVIISILVAWLYQVMN